MKNRYCEGACLPEGLMLRPKLSSQKKLTEPYCAMKEKSQAKSLSKWKLIPERKTGPIYTPLTCDVGTFEYAKLSAVAILFKPIKRNIKNH
ncbi:MULTISPECIES: hypothetical protein [unclassified Microcoleus]|uniref:hypothetical protein n=1 Tax=unclassified Microcoleus TaxID=2642155 RepID=UPI002FD3397B